MKIEHDIYVLLEENKKLTAEVSFMSNVIMEQSQTITVLTNRITELENKQSKNSSNSSKPPSTDQVRRTKSLRTSSGKPSGGQKGHPGNTPLAMVEVVDHCQIHNVTKCNCCGEDITKVAVKSYKRRQVKDIPPLIVEVTEHMAEQKECPHCQTISTASFPQGVSQPMNYGDNIRALIIYLLNFQLLPVGRTANLLKDFLGIDISKGTVVNIQNECSSNLIPFEQTTVSLLQKQTVAHFDETGFYIENLRQWLHVASTKELTLYLPHAKRGKEAMDAMGVLPGFEGTAIHDFWSSYMEFGCKHGLCNVHHLRDLTYCAEQEKSMWADQMMRHLLTIKEHVDNAVACGQRCLDAAHATALEEQYDALVLEGKKQHPVAEKQKGKRGRAKKTKTQNMIERFSQHRQSILGFMHDFEIPFGNNLAEQDIRMTKTKQKVSGCFRSIDGAIAFARIRSYISTMRKQGQNIVEAISSAIKGHPIMPQIQNIQIVSSG